MKSLPEIKADNRISRAKARDFGGMCEWFVFVEGDLLGCFVKKSDAHEFGADYEFQHRVSVTISKAQRKESK